MKLETSRLLLQPFSQADAASFRHLNADPQVMEHYPNLLSAAESDASLERIQNHFTKNTFGLWCVKLKADSSFVGFVGLQNVPFESHFTPAVEVGWRILPQYWNKGYATEAAVESLRDGFTRLQLQEIVAMTIPVNVRSRRVMEKLGMTYDSNDDFINPRLPENHPMAPHVLYRLKKDHFKF